MPFPIYPDVNQDETMFQIDDPFGLRTMIFPLFSFHHSIDGLLGLGTAFRIDCEGNAMTAYHVIEDQVVLTGDVDNPIGLSKEWRPLGLDSMGIAYGKLQIPDKFWMNIKGLEANSGYSLDIFTAEKPINVNEVAILGMPSNLYNKNEHPFLPADLSSEVKEGDKLLAVGFSELEPQKIFSNEGIVTISAYMSGSFRTVTDVLPNGVSVSRSWPTLIVDGDWPSGMSGGPVFNEAGKVVGLVSTGVEGQYATARWLLYPN